MNLLKQFADVLRWNVYFQIPVPCDDNQQMVKLLTEEYEEYRNADTKEKQLDALGDMMVVALGICARKIHKPTISTKLLSLSGGKQSIVLDMYVMDAVVNALLGNYGYQQALDELITVLDVVIQQHKVETDTIVETIMAANWKKFWTLEQIKSLPTGYTLHEIPTGAVVKKGGKVMKPPTFVHPEVLKDLSVKINPDWEKATHEIDFPVSKPINVGPPPKPIAPLKAAASKA